MRSLGQNPSLLEIENMIKEIDEDNSGTIEFNEFLILMNKNLNDNADDSNMSLPFNLIDK